MKKTGNIIFWVAISIVILVLLYMIYNKYRPNTEVKQIAPQTTQTPQPTAGKPGDTAGEQAGEAEATPGETPDPSEEIMAPDFTLEDPQGKKVKLSDYRGKVVVLNFWTTWCGYCVREMPDLNSAAAKLEESGDGVLLAIDVQETKEEVSKFLEEKKLSLTALMDTKGEVAAMYGVDAFPTTFFIRRDGTVYGYIGGQTNEETILSTVEKIK